MNLEEFRDFTDGRDGAAELWIVMHDGEQFAVADLSFEEHTTDGTNLMIESRKK